MNAKQCGNCRWWGMDHKTIVKNGLYVIHFMMPCMNKLTGIEWLKPRYKTEGQECPVFEERKE